MQKTKPVFNVFLLTQNFQNLQTGQRWLGSEGVTADTYNIFLWDNKDVTELDSILQFHEQTKTHCKIT